MRKLFTLGSVFILLVTAGCQDPQQVYFDLIAANGFIPMRIPMSGVGSGTLVNGTPDALNMLAPSGRCLPYTIDGKPSELRWVSDTSIGEKHYSATLDFNAKLNSIVAAGTPAFTFNLNMKEVKKVDFTLDEAKVDMIDQISFQDYFQKQMGENCRRFFTTNAFIVEGLEASKMSFTFLDSFSGKIALTADKVKQIVDIAVDVQWDIENSFTLVIKAPKFVGYHLAKLRPEDNGQIKMIAFSADDNGFVWKDVTNPANHELYENSLSSVLFTR